jgi:hypothetical protein
MGYLMVLYIRLGIKIGDLHAKDFYSFYNRLIFACDNVYKKKILIKLLPYSLEYYI